jgi:aspartyl-tRNA synthetase
MIGTPSESGSAIFKLDYFGRDAFLAQSPQLYKQMMVMGDVPRVFEIGPVFRAEKSLTHRHLTEFVGLDVEMALSSSYKEVLDVLEGTLTTILVNLERQTALVAAARAALVDHGLQCPPPVVLQVPDEVVVSIGIARETSEEGTVPRTGAATDQYGGRIGPNRVLRMTFSNAAQLLRDHGQLPTDGPAVDDFSTAQEKALGAIIKTRYGVDLYIVDEFFRSARPFYTMLHPADNMKTCSYDMYLRGEEICSGAQRIHDAELLRSRISECGINPDPLNCYVDAFQYGAWPHGGFGLGLERIVLFFLGLPDVRMVSLFPRDPRRLAP